MKLVAQLSARWRVLGDTDQWILQYKKKAKKEDWGNVSFIGSTKRILMRCIREANAPITGRAQSKLDRLPDTFKCWRDA